MLQQGRSLTGPAIAHLQKRRDFLAARNGARAHSAYFVLQLHDRSAAERDSRQTASGTPVDNTALSIGNLSVRNLRVGYTVTKKIGNAVTRNRVRRRLRAAVALAKIPPAAAGHDAVIIAKSAAQDAPFTDLILALERAFAKALQPRKSTPNQTNPSAALQNRPKRGKPAPIMSDTANSKVARS